MTDPLVRLVDGAAPAALFRQVRRAVTSLSRPSYWRTFWFDFGEPHCVVEDLGLALHPHVGAPGIVGLEWWIGRMRTDRVPLDFHHDRDNALFERTGRVVHPDVSTVFFLNPIQHGGQLFVTDQRLVRKRGAFRLEPEAATRSQSVSPAANRFALFDGRLFHGVLDADTRVPGGATAHPGEERWTVILNWWSRRPEDVPKWAETKAYRALATTTGRTPRPPSRGAGRRAGR